MGHGIDWTQEETKYLIENWESMTTQQLALKLNRGRASIIGKAHALELPKKVKTPKVINREVRASQKRFDLKPGDLILAPYSANTTNDDKIHRRKFVVTAIYPHMFEARLRGSKLVRGFPRNLYIAGLIRRCEDED